MFHTYFWLHAAILGNPLPLLLSPSRLQLMSTLSAFHLHRNVSSEESLELYFLKSSFPYFIIFFNTSVFQTRCHQNVRFQKNKVEDKIPPEDYTMKSLRFWSMYKMTSQFARFMDAGRRIEGCYCSWHSKQREDQHNCTSSPCPQVLMDRDNVAGCI